MSQSPTVTFAKTVQAEAQTALWDALADHGRESPAYVQALAVYDATVATLLCLLGPNAPCGEVDAITAGLFSDIWKDRNGSRPSGLRWSLGKVNAWLDSQRDLPFDDVDDLGGDEIASDTPTLAPIDTPEPWQVAVARAPGLNEAWLTGY